MSKLDELQFEYKAGCLTVRASGRTIISQKDKTFRAITTMTESQSVRAVVVDLREVPGPFTFIDRFELGEMAARYLSHMPLAALALESQVDPKRIGQLVARNRGASLELFTTTREAGQWLAG